MTKTINKISRDNFAATLATAGWQAETINKRGGAVLARVRRLDGEANTPYEDRTFIASELRSGRVVECRSEIGKDRNGCPIVRLMPLQ
jgi:hypothetical protein